jgi:Peptidase family M23
MRLKRITLASVILLGSMSPSLAAKSADRPSLHMPIDCEPGVSCFIQNYPDHDSGGGVRDYMCGARSYDDHDGLDIRLPSLEAQRRGVNVLATAKARVLFVVNDQPDQLIGDSKSDALKGRECGNGVLLDLSGGWTAQYCHMARGSVKPVVGQSVKAGEVLGRVGLSGESQSPHLHFAVRRNGKAVDPFAPDLSSNACGAGGGKPLWTRSARLKLAYRGAEIITADFATGPVTAAQIDEQSVPEPAENPEALTFYVRAIGLRDQDQYHVVIRYPDGSLLMDQAMPIAGDKADWVGFIGARRPFAGWLAGTYTAEASIVRFGAIVAAVKGELKF